MQENTHKEPRKGTLTEQAAEDVVLEQKEKVRTTVRSAALGIDMAVPDSDLPRVPPPRELTTPVKYRQRPRPFASGTKAKRTGSKANQYDANGQRKNRRRRKKKN